MPLYRDGRGALRMVLVRRAEGGVHGGQLAFPGGRVEPADPSLSHAALREAHEEIGLDPGAVTVLAALPVVETRTSGVRIAPFLGAIVRPAQWTPAPREVDEVLEVPVAALSDPELRGEQVEFFPGWPAPQQIEFIRVGPHRLWGATYRIVEPLLPRLAAGEWPV